MLELVLLPLPLLHLVLAHEHDVRQLLVHDGAEEVISLVRLPAIVVLYLVLASHAACVGNCAYALAHALAFEHDTLLAHLEDEERAI